MRRRGARPRARIERDSLGPKAVPADALHGIFSERARETFALSGLRPHPAFIRSLGMIKKAAAQTNRRLGLLPPRLARAIEWAAGQVLANRVDAAFVLDVFQAGAGTPHHMNANEVIANLANERLGGRRGVYEPVHPHNHVNLGQSLCRARSTRRSRRRFRWCASRSWATTRAWRARRRPASWSSTS